MKKILALTAVLLIIATAGAFAQTNYQFTQFQKAFQDFASGTASALPLETSVGLNWSDYYIGNFPHFGIGATVGFASIPYSAVDSAMKAFNVSLPSNLEFLKTLGAPVPAYTIDVRIGGFVLPFDIGLKFGYLPPNAFSSGGGVSADYLTIGGDFRYMLVKDSGFVPGISVGIGYTYMRGNVSVPGVFNGPITIQNVSYNGTTHNIGFTDPNLDFFWNTHVIDLKAQLSKNLLFLTPYIGLGMSYGISNAGGGMQSAMTVDGHPATQSDLDQINSAFGTNFTLQNPGFGVTAGANGFAMRAFGGMSINIFILKIGLGASYEFLSGSIGAMVNARIQF